MMVSFIFEVLPPLFFPGAPIINHYYRWVYEICHYGGKIRGGKSYKINDTIIFSSQKYLLDMGFILDKNGENVVLCPAMVYVGSTRV